MSTQRNNQKGPITRTVRSPWRLDREHAERDIFDANRRHIPSPIQSRQKEKVYKEGSKALMAQQKHEEQRRAFRRIAAPALVTLIAGGALLVANEHGTDKHDPTPVSAVPSTGPATVPAEVPTPTTIITAGREASTVWDAVSANAAPGTDIRPIVDEVLAEQPHTADGLQVGEQFSVPDQNG